MLLPLCHHDPNSQEHRGLHRSPSRIVHTLFAGDASKLSVLDIKLTRPLVLPTTVGLYLQDNHVFVGDAPGGPAYLVGTYSSRS